MSDEPVRTQRAGAAERVQAWLNRFIVEHDAGEPLPLPADIAGLAGAGERTVRRLLEKYAADGRIVRTPGQGSFVGSIKTGVDRAGAGGVGGVERVASTVREWVATGRLREGDALPPVKFVGAELRVAARTVLAAYRLLCREGLATQGGRSYLVGRPAPEPSTHGNRHVAFVIPPEELASAYDHHFLGLALRRCERELALHGCVFQPTPRSSLPRLLRAGTRAAMSGVIVYYAPFELEDRRHLEHLRELRSLRDGYHGRLLIIGHLQSIPVPGLQYLSLPQVSTAVARSIAERAAALPDLAGIQLFHEAEDVSLAALAHLVGALKLLGELRRRKPSLPFRTYVRLHGAHDSGNAALELASELAQPGLVNKYGLTAELIAEELRVTRASNWNDAQDDFGQSAEGDRPQHTLSVFTQDAVALEALAACRAHGIPVPDRAMLLSLEGSLAALQSGISTCQPDWDVAGYQMAQVVLGSRRVARTSRGFLRLQAQWLHRGTTR